MEHIIWKKIYCSSSNEKNQIIWIPTNLKKLDLMKFSYEDHLILLKKYSTYSDNIEYDNIMSSILDVLSILNISNQFSRDLVQIVMEYHLEKISDNKIYLKSYMQSNKYLNYYFLIIQRKMSVVNIETTFILNYGTHTYLKHNVKFIINKNKFFSITNENVVYNINDDDNNMFISEFICELRTVFIKNNETNLLTSKPFVYVFRNYDSLMMIFYNKSNSNMLGFYYQTNLFSKTQITSGSLTEIVSKCLFPPTNERNHLLINYIQKYPDEYIFVIFRETNIYAIRFSPNELIKLNIFDINSFEDKYLDYLNNYERYERLRLL